MRRPVILAGTRLACAVLLGGLLTGCASDGPSTTGPSGKALAAFELYKDDYIFFDYKAFVWDPLSGDWASAWGAPHPKAAIGTAQARCRKRGGACKLYALGKTILFDESPETQAASTVKYMERLTKVPENRAGHGPNLSAEEIRRAFAGKEISGRTDMGLTFVAQLFRSGSIKLQLHRQR